LDRDGNTPPLHEQGKKDVIMIEPNETIRYITKFETFADTVTPYVYHCHILMHEDGGMMGQFVVVPNDIHVGEFEGKSTYCYPNPFGDVLNVKSQSGDALERISITSELGELVYQSVNTRQSQINTGALAPGIYFVETVEQGLVTRQKLIKL
jgi:bilirubin oxidase